MNSFADTVYRDLTCAAGAALITILLSVTFVQATSLPPGMHATAACSSRCSPSTPGSASPSRPFW